MEQSQTIGPKELAEIIRKVHTIPVTDDVLNFLAETAMSLTHSRNAMFARVNDELGVMELTNGAGDDWTPSAIGQTIEIGVDEGAGIVAYVAAKKKTVVAQDVAREPRYKRLFGPSKSEAAVPIIDRHGRMRGVLNVESDEEDQYTEYHVHLLEALAGLAALVITRDEMLRREEALFEIGTAVERATTEGELLRRLIGIASEQLRFQSCSIFLFDSGRNEYVLRATSGSLQDQEGKAGYAPGDGLTGYVASEAIALRLDDPQHHDRWRGRLLEIPAHEIASYLGVPIIHRGKSIGAIRALRRVSTNPHHDNRFTEDDERILSAVGEQVAVGIESIRTLQRVVRVERMAAWGELSAKSSHMIGNRVFALRGDVNELGHLIKEPGLKIAALGEIQESLSTNVQRVEEILQEFRDFVTATQLSPVRADFNFLVKEAVAEVFPKRASIKLVYNLAEHLPEVEVDARRFRRAITEVVENALTFFSEGELRVTTKLADVALLVQAKLPTTTEHCAVIVEDQGPGVSAEQKQRIFEPFFSSRQRGMGLGLSIVKGILEAHGGAVMETGEPGHGARFVMLVPAATRP